jgi:hypothetical protein
MRCNVIAFAQWPDFDYYIAATCGAMSTSLVTIRSGQEKGLSGDHPTDDRLLSAGGAAPAIVETLSDIDYA